jgi:hypothetical protein
VVVGEALVDVADVVAGSEHDSGQAVAALVRCYVHRPGRAAPLPQSLIAAEAET